MDENDFLLPDDYTEEQEEEVNTEAVEAEEPTEAEATDEPQAEEVAEQQPSPFLIAKYNKAEIPLDEETARNLSQLGMFYQEKIQPEYEKLKGVGEKFGKLEQLASLYGMDVDQLYESLNNQYIESTAQSQGITPEQVRKEQELAQKEQMIAEQLTKADQEKKSAEMYDKFISAYPDVKIESIKPETWQAVDKGVDLVTAYTMQLNKEYQEQLSQLKQITNNKKTSPGVATNQNGGAEPAKDDDFLSGFMGD